ncbi:MAG TPA: tripartite tricarboxylate transporter substrate-binding protein [Stellaceae bacterium]|nr:tripartite tricarboxylate transporter substrate-binding protein [Stellaceae bacterium]
MKRLIAVAAMCMTIFSGRAAAQQDVEAHYKGKNIDFLISTGPGAAYDTYARTLAQHMKNHMPGNPNFIPMQKEGAGGMTAATYIYNIAPRDGTVIAMVNNPIPYLPLLGDTHAHYDSLKLNWIGSMEGETALLIASTKSGIKTIEEARKKELTVGTSGAGSGSYFNARLINRFVGTKLKLVVGYPASSDVLLALDRGEVDGFPGMMLSTLALQKPEWLVPGHVNFLLQLALTRHPQMKDVPTIMEKLQNPADKGAVTLALAPLIAARPIMAPPDIPAAYIQALQTAFDETMVDPDFLADLKRSRLDTYGWMTGPKLEELIRSVYKTNPKDVATIAAMLKQ